MVIEPLSAEDEAKLARNDKIIEDLEANIGAVVKGIEFDIKDTFPQGDESAQKEILEIMRDMLDVAVSDDKIFLLFPKNADMMREFIDGFNGCYGEIDCVIERDLPNISNPQDLSNNLKMYMKSYLNEILSIMESNPNITREEIEEDVKVIAPELYESMIVRAGYDKSLDSTIVYRLSPDEEQKMDIEGIPAEKKPSKKGEPDLPLGRMRYK